MTNRQKDADAARAPAVDGNGIDVVSDIDRIDMNVPAAMQPLDVPAPEGTETPAE